VKIYGKVINFSATNWVQNSKISLKSIILNDFSTRVVSTTRVTVPDWAGRHSWHVLDRDSGRSWSCVLVQSYDWLGQISDVENQNRAVLQSSVEIVSVVGIPRTGPNWQRTFVPTYHKPLFYHDNCSTNIIT